MLGQAGWEVLQRTQYYPSGTPFIDSYKAGVQAYKFTGKEFITMYGLNWQDYGARWLDNVRMQWTSVYPLCEKYYAISPYVYCSDNPMNKADPDGRADEDSNGTPAQQLTYNPKTKKMEGQYTSAQSTTNMTPKKVLTSRSATNSKTDNSPKTESTQKQTAKSNVETPTVNIKNHVATHTSLLDFDLYASTKTKDGNSNTEITMNKRAGTKETETTTTLGIIKTSVNAGGHGGSIGVGAVSVGVNNGSFTLDVSQKTYGTKTTLGMTTSVNLENLIVIPVSIVIENPEVVFLTVP